MVVPSAIARFQILGMVEHSPEEFRATRIEAKDTQHSSWMFYNKYKAYSRIDNTDYLPCSSNTDECMFSASLISDFSGHRSEMLTKILIYKR